MTWLDRLQPEIILTSPSGQVFTASWRGNSRTKEKRLGVFEYAKIPGAVIQRMGSGPVRYPLSFYFDGPNHDIIASNFFAACSDDSNSWSVNHPVHGLLTLDLMTITEENNPVESGNITLVTTEWIEAITIVTLQSVPQLEETIKDQSTVVKTKAAEQFFDKVVNIYNNVVAFKNKVVSTINKVKAVINRVKQTVVAVRSSIESVYRNITNTIQSAVLSVTSLAGEVQLLIDLPGQMVTDTVSRFTFYGELVDDMFSDSVVDDMGSLALKELIATSCVIGVVQTVINAEITNREDALAYADIVSDTFIKVTDYLDAGQAALGSLAIDKQFFSQSQSFNDTALLVAQTIQLLLIRSYDLAVAKRFTLAHNRAPIEIAITEGVDLDEFISTNRLKGNEILLLPAGKEVVVYL